MKLFRLQRIWAKEEGLTLIELLAVAVILVVLALLALPVYAGVMDKAREGKQAGELRVIEDALEQYYAERGHYPSRLGLLVERGFLKPTAFTAPSASDSNVVYYYYAVNRLDGDDVASRFWLGDPGGEANCSSKGTRSPRCGNDPNKDAHWVTETEQLPAGLEFVRVGGVKKAAS